jgi:hypothetical protein
VSVAISKKLFKIDLRFSDCEYLIEANSFEVLALWKEWHVAVPWKEDGSGFMFKVGSLGGRPVMLSFSFAHINGHRVAFYDSPSQVVDHKKIDNFLRKNFAVTHEGRWAHCDAMNFGHCISCVVDVVRDRAAFEWMHLIRKMMQNFENKLEKRYE